MSDKGDCRKAPATIFSHFVLRVRVRSGACLKGSTFKWNFPQSTLYLSVSMSVCPTQLGAVVWVLVGLGETWKKILKKIIIKKWICLMKWKTYL